MTTISQTSFSNSFFSYESSSNLTQISPEFVPKGSINHMAVLGPIMALPRPGDKLLCEPMRENSLSLHELGDATNVLQPDCHDDVIKWKHFSRYWPFVRGIHRSPVNPLTKANDAELGCFL